MRHEPPDRVPVMCQLALGHYFLNVDLPPHQIWFTSEGFAEALLALRARYRFDGILINIPGRDPDWLRNVESIEETKDGEVITWRDGMHTIVPWDDNPQYEPDKPQLAPLPDFYTFDPSADFDRIDDYPRYTWGIYHTPHLPGKAPGLLHEPPAYFYRTIRLVQEAVGETISIHGEVFSPFTYFMELFGYQAALMGLVTEPAKAKAILTRLAEPAIAWGTAQAKAGVDAVLISSAFAGGGFISREMYAEFVLPYERMLTEAIHTACPDTPLYTHTCGKLGDRLELLAATGTDGVDTLDPPPLGDSDLADAKARIGNKLFIKGNMNSVALLTDTRDQVAARARRALEAGKRGSGYILSTACSVAPRVAPWKLEMLVDLAEQYGQYNE